MKNDWNKLCDIKSKLFELRDNPLTDEIVHKLVISAEFLINSAIARQELLDKRSIEEKD